MFYSGGYVKSSYYMNECSFSLVTYPLILRILAP